MITIEEKLQTFSAKILENVKKESEDKFNDFAKKTEDFFEKEKEKVLNEAEQIITNARKKAKSDKNRIIYKAKMEKEHAILVKHYELYEDMLSEIKKIARNFTSKQEYENFLIRCVENGISNIDAKEVVILLRAEDKKEYSDKILALKNKFDKKIKINICKDDIIGGCIVENGKRTFRTDCSIDTLIEDNKELIGKILKDNLE